MSKKNICLGKAGEGLALSLLRKEGYRILVRNYKSKLGEIDLIAKDRDTICFIEVKTRQTPVFGEPSEAVNIFKQRKISQVALYYLKSNRLLDKKARFDVVAVSYNENGPCLDLIRNAFELDGNYTY